MGYMFCITALKLFSDIVIRLLHLSLKNLNATNWASGSVLSYSFGFYFSNDATKTEYILAHSSSWSIETVLPAGAITLFVKATDTNGLFTMMNREITVSPNGTDSRASLVYIIGNNALFNENAVLALILASITSISPDDTSRTSIAIFALDILNSRIQKISSIAQLLVVNQIVLKTFNLNSNISQSFLATATSVVNATLTFVRKDQSVVSSEEKILLACVAQITKYIISSGTQDSLSKRWKLNQVGMLHDSLAAASTRMLSSTNDFGDKLKQITYDHGFVRLNLNLMESGAPTFTASTNSTLAVMNSQKRAASTICIKFAEYISNFFSHTSFPRNYTMVSTVASVNVASVSSTNDVVYAPASGNITFTIQNPVQNASCLIMMENNWQSGCATYVSDDSKYVTCSCGSMGTAVAVFDTTKQQKPPIDMVLIIVLSSVGAAILCLCLLLSCTLCCGCVALLRKSRAAKHKIISLDTPQNLATQITVKSPEKAKIVNP